jgi:hypothetical protein
VPAFLEQLSNRDEGEANLRSELSELQAHHVEAVNELEKTRTLLRVQVRLLLHPDFLFSRDKKGLQLIKFESPLIFLFITGRKKLLFLSRPTSTMSFVEKEKPCSNVFTRYVCY